MFYYCCNATLSNYNSRNRYGNANCRCIRKTCTDWSWMNQNQNTNNFGAKPNCGQKPINWNLGIVYSINNPV